MLVRALGPVTNHWLITVNKTLLRIKLRLILLKIFILNDGFTFASKLLSKLRTERVRAVVIFLILSLKVSLAWLLSFRS